MQKYKSSRKERKEIQYKVTQRIYKLKGKNQKER